MVKVKPYAGNLVGIELTYTSMTFHISSAARQCGKLGSLAALTLFGQSFCLEIGTPTSGRRGGGRRSGVGNNYSGGRQQRYNGQIDYINNLRPIGPPSFGRFNRGSSFGGSNGGGRGKEGALALCVVLHGIGPSNALRHLNDMHQWTSLKRFMFKAMS